MSSISLSYGHPQALGVHKNIINHHKDIQSIEKYVLLKMHPKSYHITPNQTNMPATPTTSPSTKSFRLEVRPGKAPFPLASVAVAVSTEAQ